MALFMVRWMIPKPGVEIIFLYPITLTSNGLFFNSIILDVKAMYP